MIKKLIALLLVLLMVVPMAVACGDNKKDNGNETETETDGELSVDIDEKDPLISVIDEHIEELSSQFSFKGETFTWIGPRNFLAPETNEETGIVTDDAMYYRQRDIEDAFGLTWENYSPEGDSEDGTSPAIEAIKQDVLAGTGAYDVAYGFNMHTQVLLINNCLMNLTDFTTVDLEREWWLKDLKETLSIGGELYFLTGPIVSSYYQDAMSVLFNKQVADDYGITGLYDLVKSGEWTFDKMFEVASAIPPNANGSGAYRYADPDGMSTLIAQGYSIAQFDADGNPYILDALPTDIVNLADKFCTVYSDDTQTVHTKGSISGNHENFEEKYGYKDYVEMFADEKVLFLFIPTDEATYLRTHDVKFGILPMPKKDTVQENYISYGTSRSAFNVFVPKSVKNTQMCDVVLEAMAALGYKYFKSTYYDNMLKSRSTYDYDSKDMVDIIFATKKYDLINVIDKGASVNGDGQMVTLFNSMIEESSEGFVSRFFINSKMVNSNIKQILANIASDID